ncbi:hypothetical protein ACFL30_01350 [Candidatus Latescibacterota bacterium]
MRCKIMVTGVVISLLLLLTGGCLVTSIHPLYFEEDVVFKPELLGTWSMKDDNSNWMFKEDKDNTYKLIIFDEKTSGKFEAHLLRLGEYMFLDIFPEEPEESMNVMYYLHLVPVHSFFKVTLAGDSLALGNVDLELFEDWVEQKKADIKYEHFDDRYLLTAPTKELQEFYMKRAKEDSFTINFLFRRETE